MATFQQNLPEGFASAAELINKLTSDNAAELSDEVMQYLQFQIGAVNTEKWLQRLTDGKTQMDATGLQSVINSLIYLFRTAAANKLSEDQFREQLLSCIVFSESTHTALTSTWSTQGRSLIQCKLSDQFLDVGKLINLKWKVGMAMSSDTCKNLNSPFVCLSLTVSDGSGNIKTHDLELTMAQFRNFTNQMKEISNIIQTE